MNLICFDLEGPLAPQDNAYELMKLFPRGRKVFEVISQYDDLLTVEGRRLHEPEDTLALIIPFLVYHGITDQQVIAMG
jgi:energy-converting hydrogenase A subunit R